MIILGLFTFLFKVEACKSSQEDCREEFVEIKSNGYSSDHKCSRGAIVETVNSPPAPKPGILCHCPTNKPETAPQSSVK